MSLNLFSSGIFSLSPGFSAFLFFGSLYLSGYYYRFTRSAGFTSRLRPGFVFWNRLGRGKLDVPGFR
jgi:hypothetical protein